MLKATLATEDRENLHPQLIQPQPVNNAQFVTKVDAKERSTSPTACPFGHAQNHGNVWTGLRTGPGHQHSPIGYSKHCCPRVSEPNFTKSVDDRMRRNSNQSHRPGIAATVFRQQVEDCVFRHLNIDSQRVLS